MIVDSQPSIGIIKQNTSVNIPEKHTFFKFNSRNLTATNISRINPKRISASKQGLLSFTIDNPMAHASDQDYRFYQTPDISQDQPKALTTTQTASEINSTRKPTIAAAKDSISLRCEFIRHEENKFKQIMEMDGIRPNDIMESLNMEDNRNMIFKAGESAG